VRGLKILTVVMAVLIVLATTVLVVTIARRLIARAPTAPVATASIGAVVLDEPAGTRIATIATAGDRLAVQLQGGGADRVILLDPQSGAVVGRFSLGH
jgi:hypothetical protein